MFFLFFFFSHDDYSFFIYILCVFLNKRVVSSHCQRLASLLTIFPGPQPHPFPATFSLFQTRFALFASSFCIANTVDGRGKLSLLKEYVLLHPVYFTLRMTSWSKQQSCTILSQWITASRNNETGDEMFLLSVTGHKGTPKKKKKAMNEH